jgi:hypothetical protein
MIFDPFGGGGGTLRLNIGDAPNIGLNVGERARIDTHGVVHLTGEYRCTGARSLHMYGSLIEIVGDTVPVGNFDTLGVPAPVCNGGLHSWTGLVLPTRLPFAPGKAALFIKAFGCGDIACTLIGQRRVVELTRSGPGTSGPAPLGSGSTRTVRRSSVRAYGNARHTATATWGH